MKSERFTMSALNIAYENLYDYQALARISVRIAIGGSRNEAIVDKALAHIRNDAQEFMAILQQYRMTDDMEQRTAIELIRADAIIICGGTRQVNQTADGTIMFMPKNKRIAYNCDVLNHYERMVANVEWLMSMLPDELP